MERGILSITAQSGIGISKVWISFGSLVLEEEEDEEDDVDILLWNVEWYDSMKRDVMILS